MAYVDTFEKENWVEEQYQKYLNIIIGKQYYTSEFLNSFLIDQLSSGI